MGSERWLETIEIYTLPWDPEWKQAAETLVFPNHFRKSAEEYADRREALEVRLVRERSRGRIGDSGVAERLSEFDRKEAEIVERIRKTADRSMPLTIIRVWDGINRREHVLSFGKGQRTIVERFKQGKPLLAIVGDALPGDDFQAARPTCGDIGPSSRVPTEFVRLSDAPGSLTDVAFGEIDASVLKSPVPIDVSKDPTPGSGVLSLALSQPPAELEIDVTYPWFAEFRLFELGKDGSRAREVRFDGESSIIAPTGRREGSVSGGMGVGTVDGSRKRVNGAIGRVEIQSPQPWGYEAEVVKWHGVARKARLVSPTVNPSGGSTPRAPKPGPRSAPTPAKSPGTQPLEEASPPPLPAEPQTPGIPAASR